MTFDDDFDPDEQGENPLEIPERLKNLFDNPDKTSKLGITPKGVCPNHGKVGFGRVVLYNTVLGEDSKVVSEHCIFCLSRVLTAVVGELFYDPNESDDD